MRGMDKIHIQRLGKGRLGMTEHGLVRQDEDITFAEKLTEVTTIH